MPARLNKLQQPLQQQSHTAKPCLNAACSSFPFLALVTTHQQQRHCHQQQAMTCGMPLLPSVCRHHAMRILLCIKMTKMKLNKQRLHKIRWRATPLRLPAWRLWFEEQAQLAGKSPEEGLYVGLRMDGRVRASGRGCPPWGAFARQLPKTDGFFSGFFDAFDGRQTGFD